MNAKKNVVVFGITCFVGGLIIVFCTCGYWICHNNVLAQGEANLAPARTPSHLSQKTKHVDMEDGVVLTEVIGESKNGEVWLRTSIIKQNGKLMMMKCWQKLSANNKSGETNGQYFYRKGKMFLCQADQNGDGLTDLMILFDHAQLPLQAFKVEKNGLLLPLNGDQLKKIKKDWQMISDIITPLIEDAKIGKRQKTSEAE